MSAPLELGAEQGDDVLEELPRDVGIVIDELTKVPRRHHEAAHRSRRRHRREPRALADQCELAEMGAGRERADLVAVDGHRRFALEDDEEVHAAHLALAYDRRPGAVAPFLEVP